MSALDEATVNELDPGIRRLVVLLNEAGFDTCDSGDGKSQEARVLDYPHVAVTCRPEELLEVADRLYSVVMTLVGEGEPVVEDGQEMPAWIVEGSYSPMGRSSIVLLSRRFNASCPPRRAERGGQMSCRNPESPLPSICLCPLAGAGYGPRQVLADKFINGWLGEGLTRAANALAACAAVPEERLWRMIFTLEYEASGAMEMWRSTL